MSFKGFLKKIYRKFSEIASHIPKKIFVYLDKLPKDKKKVLLVSHELSLTGAPFVLLNIAKILKSNGFEVVVVSFIGGELKKQFEVENIPVCISQCVQSNVEEIRKLASRFDLVIANTVVTYTTVWHILPVIKPLWLLHETQIFETFFFKWYSSSRYGCPPVIDVLASMDEIYTVSEYSKTVFDKYNSNVHVIHNGIPDVEFQRKNTEKSKLSFTFIGSVNERKAVDVFVDAVSLLSKENRLKAQFNIVGDVSEKFAKDLRHRSKAFMNWFGHVKDKSVLAEIYKNTDLLVCVSLDDTAPLVVTEAAAYGVPSVISENVGSTYLIKNNESGFIVPTGDVTALSSVLTKVINNPEILIPMGQKVRENFLKTSTIERFETDFMQIVNSKIDINRGKNVK